MATTTTGRYKPITKKKTEKRRKKSQRNFTQGGGNGAQLTRRQRKIQIQSQGLSQEPPNGPSCTTPHSLFKLAIKPTYLAAAAAGSWQQVFFFFFFLIEGNYEPGPRTTSAHTILVTFIAVNSSSAYAVETGDSRSI